MPLSDSEAARRTTQSIHSRTAVITKGLPHTLNYPEIGSVEIPETALTSKSQIVSSAAEFSSGIDILDGDCRNCRIER